MTDENPFPNLAGVFLASKYLSPASVVLDVGCNRGQTGKVLKEAIGCKVIGIDNSPRALKEAQKVLDKVILADIESPKEPFGDKFDMIILSNILEHLRDPLAILKSLKPQLKPTAYFLIAVPNIAFWPVRLSLLRGEFNYKDEGILNKNHLRFFTCKNLEKLLNDVDLEIEERATNYLGWRACVAKFWPTLLASQFLVICRPRSSYSPSFPHHFPNRPRLTNLLKTRGKILLNLVLTGQFARAKNYFLTNINMLKRPYCVGSYPTTIIIDPGNVCNLSCKLCITGQRKSKRLPKLLSFSDFKKIIDQLGKWVINLDLYNWGEPFLNKDIFKMIAYAKRLNLEVAISTNLNYFNLQMAQEVVKSGMDRLILSLHGATGETTQCYMVGSDFDSVLKNLKLLIQTKKNLKSQKPQIIWRYVVSRHNEGEINKARKLSQKLGVDLETLPLKINVGSDPGEIKQALRENGSWLPRDRRYRAPLQADCYWPWEIVSVNSDGTVQPCCVFSSPQFDFGNLLKTPFKEIWNGQKYQTARRVIRQKIKTDKTTICGLCVASNFIAK